MNYDCCYPNRTVPVLAVAVKDPSSAFASDTVVAVAAAAGLLNPADSPANRSQVHLRWRCGERLLSDWSEGSGCHRQVHRSSNQYGHNQLAPELD